MIDVTGLQEYAKEASVKERAAWEKWMLTGSGEGEGQRDFLPSASIIAFLFGCNSADFFARFFVKFVFSDFAVHELLPCSEVLEKA